MNELANLFDELYPQKKSLLSTKEKIVLTRMKLKINLSFICISKLFKTIAAPTCRYVFYDTLKKLSTILQPLLT